MGRPSRMPMAAAVNALLISQIDDANGEYNNQAPGVGCKSRAVSQLVKQRRHDGRNQDGRMVVERPVPGHAAAQPGTSPRTSRISRVPNVATATAATGPPRTEATRTGATPTSTTVPPGMRTDDDDPRSTTAIQNNSPRAPPMGSQSDHAANTQTATSAAAATTSAIRSCSRVGTRRGGASVTKQVWRRQRRLHTGHKVLSVDPTTPSEPTLPRLRRGRRDSQVARPHVPPGYPFDLPSLGVCVRLHLCPLL